MPSQGLGFARGSLPTQRGEVAVEWARVGHDRVVLQVEVPANVRATVAIPEAPGRRYRGFGEGAPVRVGTEDGRELFEVGSGRTGFVALRG